MHRGEVMGAAAGAPLRAGGGRGGGGDLSVAHPLPHPSWTSLFTPVRPFPGALCP